MKIQCSSKLQTVFPRFLSGGKKVKMWQLKENINLKTHFLVGERGNHFFSIFRKKVSEIRESSEKFSGRRLHQGMDPLL